MKELITRLCRLLEVKSLVTLALTAAMVALLFAGDGVPREMVTLFSTAYGAVITYFFTRKDGGESK